MSAAHIRAVKELAAADHLEPDGMRVHWVLPRESYRALDRYGRVRYYPADVVDTAVLFGTESNAEA